MVMELAEMLHIGGGHEPHTTTLSGPGATGARLRALNVLTHAEAPIQLKP
jgi:hypothetical protein